MRPYTLSFLVLFLAAATGCSSGQTDSSEPGQMEVDETVGGGGALVYDPPEFCEWVRSATHGGGLYRVDRLVVKMEPTGNDRVPEYPYTYIHLELIDGWTDDARQAPVARMEGGQYPDGSGRRVTTMLHLEKSQTLATLLRPPDDQGYYSLPYIGLFEEQANGRFASGVYFDVAPLEPDVIEALVRANYESTGDCPYVIEPHEKFSPPDSLLSEAGTSSNDAGTD